MFVCFFVNVILGIMIVFIPICYVLLFFTALFSVFEFSKKHKINKIYYNSCEKKEEEERTKKRTEIMFFLDRAFNQCE